MTMNVGSGYSMMNGMSAMGMSGMSGMSGAGGSGNMPQYFLNKYGCEDCFKKSPYPYEYPKPFVQEPKHSYEPSFLKRFINNIIGG